MKAMTMQAAPISNTRLWASRIISGLPVLFLLLDSVMKLFKPAIVVETTAKLGYPESLIVPLGDLPWEIPPSKRDRRRDAPHRTFFRAPGRPLRPR